MKKTKAPLIVREPEWNRWGWMVVSVAERHGVSVEELLGRDRRSLVAAARQDLMTSLWCSGVAYAEVGRLLGLDHSTVIYGVRQNLGAA